MSSFHSFIRSLNIYEYLLCARSMICPMNKTKPMPSWVFITSHMWCSSTPLVLLIVWRIWLGLSSPKLLKMIKMLRWREVRRVVDDQNWCEEFSCSLLTSFHFDCLHNFHNGLANVICSIGSTWFHFKFSWSYWKVTGIRSPVLTAQGLGVTFIPYHFFLFLFLWCKLWLQM